MNVQSFKVPHGKEDLEKGSCPPLGQAGIWPSEAPQAGLRRAAAQTWAFYWPGGVSVTMAIR